MGKAIYQAPEKIIGTQINLVRYRSVFSRAIFNIIKNNKKFIVPWVGFLSSIKTLEDEKRYVRKAHQQWHKGTGFRYVLQLKDKTCIGRIYTSLEFDGYKKCTLAYFLDPKYAKKGYMSQALAMVENLVFDQFKLNKMVLRVDNDNKVSKKFSERNGYTLEGLLRQEDIENNKVIDRCIYSKLRSEWKKRRTVRS